MTTDPQWPGEPRAVAIDADRHPTEADARKHLGGNDTNLPYLGIWTVPGHTDRIHLFADGRTAEEYLAAGWVREVEA